MRKLGVSDTAWLMVLSSDVRAMLACNLTLRWSAGVNVVAGNTDLTSNKVFIPSLWLLVTIWCFFDDQITVFFCVPLTVLVGCLCKQAAKHCYH